jgi:hypothetical protein
MSKAGFSVETVARLQAMEDEGPSGFDHFIADLFELAGWKTEVTQQSHDEGIDVIGRKTDLIDQTAYIQTKRYNHDNTVGRPDIQQYGFLREENRECDHAVVATTSSFSTPAYELADETNVKLLDGDAIAAIIYHHDLYDLLDEYVDEDIKVPDDLKPVDKDGREQYFLAWTPNALSPVLESFNLIDIADRISQHHRGRARIETLDCFSQAIDGSIRFDELPLILADGAWLIDQNWYYCDRLPEREDELRNMDDNALNRDTAEVVCFEIPDGFSVAYILNPDATIQRRHMHRLEDFVDHFADIVDPCVDDDPWIRGVVIGSQVAGDNYTQRKYARFQPKSNFRVETYEDLLERSIKANRAIIQTIRSVASVSNDNDLIEVIDRLQGIAR